MDDIKRAIRKRGLNFNENEDTFYCCLNRHYLFHDLNELSNFSDNDDDFSDDKNKK